MKRYLIGFFLTYLLSEAIFVGMLLIAVYNWLFTSSPMWFNVLSVIVVTLPFLAGGELTGRRQNSDVKKPLVGFLILLAAVFLIAAAGWAVAGEGAVLICPGALLGGVLKEMLSLKGDWESALTLAGQLLFPILFHLGWKMGKASG